MAPEPGPAAGQNRGTRGDRRAARQADRLHPGPGGPVTGHGAGRRLSASTAADLRAAGLDPCEVHRVVSAALAEDLRYGPDVTTEATVPAGAAAVAQISPRAPGVLAGAPVARAVFDTVLGGGYEVLT